MAQLTFGVTLFAAITSFALIWWITKFFPISKGAHNKVWVGLETGTRTVVIGDWYRTDTVVSPSWSYTDIILTTPNRPRYCLLDRNRLHHVAFRNGIDMNIDSVFNTVLVRFS